MIGDLGVPELLIILALAVLLFGAGKLGRLGKDLGQSVKEFRRAVHDDDDEPPTAGGQAAPASDTPPTTAQAAPPPAALNGSTPRPPSIF